MKRILAFYLASLLIVGFVAWTIAPSEKPIYKTQTKTKVVTIKAPKPVEPSYGNPDCRFHIKVGDKGFISYGTFTGKVGEVLSYDNQACDYNVKLNSGDYIQVDDNNFNAIPKEG